MEPKFYSLEEVRQQNGKNGSKIWIIVKDSIYDCTDYIDEHPPGGDLITEYAGKDATRAFDDAGHSSDAKKDLKPLKIGELREEDRKGKKPAKTPEKSAADAGKVERRSCCSYITCGLIG